MSFAVYDTNNSTNVTIEQPSTTNYNTIDDYFKKVYGKNATPSIKDLTFLWSHIAGDLDNWAKNGLPGLKTTFRWNNENLPSPKIVMTSIPTDVVASAVQLREQVDEFVKTLPSESQIWTPDYFVYPQTAINRWNPRWWNQYYYTWNNLNDNIKGADGEGNQQAKSCIISKPLTIEGSNTGGPDKGTGQTFFYLATGSGIKFTTERVGNAGGACVALNKLHAYYVGECYKAYPTTSSFGGAGGDMTQEECRQALINVVTGLTVKDSANNNPIADEDTLIDAIEAALYSTSGYYHLPKDQTNTVVENLLWTPITTAYADSWDLVVNIDGTPWKGKAVDVQTKYKKVWCLCVYLIGSIPGSDLAIPNPKNIDCNASNCLPGSIGAKTSSPATQPYEYLAQVATNLTIADNILDYFVTKVMGTDYLNVSAMLNLCQYNALGHFTCEIPCNPPAGSVGTSSPVLTSSNGSTLLPSTDGGDDSVPTWWSGNPSILGINDYSDSNPDFEIPVKFLG